MHTAEHKKRQRIGKRIVASRSAPSNQKPKKTNSSQEQCCNLWTFHFLLLFLLTPRTKIPQKQRTGSQHKTTFATTAKKERGEKQKKQWSNSVSKSLFASEREREEMTKHDGRDNGRRESVILGSTSCPRKYVLIFNICPYYPSFCPFLFSQVEPSQNVFFYSLPYSANNPMFKKHS